MSALDLLTVDLEIGGRVHERCRQNLDRLRGWLAEPSRKPALRVYERVDSIRGDIVIGDVPTRDVRLVRAHGRAAS